jgi:hypothetical protein
MSTFVKESSALEIEVVNETEINFYNDNMKSENTH